MEVRTYFRTVLQARRKFSASARKRIRCTAFALVASKFAHFNPLTTALPLSSIMIAVTTKKSWASIAAKGWKMRHLLFAETRKDESAGPGKPTDFKSDGYKFHPDVFQCSAEVASFPGYAMERARLRHLPNLKDGFLFIEDHLRSIGRSKLHLCPLEMRLPKPRSGKAFYRPRLRADVGSRTLQGMTLIPSRPSMYPARGGLDAPSLHAFTYATETIHGSPSFQTASSVEIAHSLDAMFEWIVAPGDTTRETSRKIKWVIAAMPMSLDTLGVDWSADTVIDIYTVHDARPFMGDELLTCDARHADVTWHHAVLHWRMSKLRCRFAAPSPDRTI